MVGVTAPAIAHLELAAAVGIGVRRVERCTTRIGSAAGSATIGAAAHDGISAGLRSADCERAVTYCIPREQISETERSEGSARHIQDESRTVLSPGAENIFVCGRRRGRAGSAAARENRQKENQN